MMYEYTFAQWLLFFYVYCLAGWCFESTYVSIRQKKFVNRGFLNGPFLPIYGSGAIIVLFTTLPFSGTPALVYLIGTLSATLLEYVTGAAMEAVFKVRYWDYSNQKCNLQGYICLSSSIAWGFFSLGLVYGFHRLIERFVFLFPAEVLSVATFLITIVLVVDCTLSFRTAFELRDVLVRLDEAREEFKRLQRRLEIVETILADEGNKKLEQMKEQVKEQLQTIGQVQETGERQILEPLTGQRREQFVEELEQLREKQILLKDKLKVSLSGDKLRLLRRNPSAVSARYHTVFDDYKTRLHDLSPQELKDKLRELSLEELKEEVKEELTGLRAKRKGRQTAVKTAGVIEPTETKEK